MKTALVAAVLVVLAAPALPAGGQSPPPIDSRTKVTEAYLFEPVLLTMRDGTVATVALTGADDEGLLVLRGGRETRIPREDIARLTLARPGRRASAVVPGLLAGGFLYGLTYRHPGLPAFFIQGGHSRYFLSPEATFLGMGVGAGVLADWLLAQLPARTYFRTDSPTGNARAWRSLVGSLRREAWPRVHLALAGGFMDARSCVAFADAIRAAGYGNILDYGNQDFRNGRWTMLRRIRATFSLTPRLDVGASFAWVNEPGTWASRHTVLPSWFSYTRFRYDGTGAFLVGVWRPFGTSPRWFGLSLGAGAGRVWAAVRRTTHVTGIFAQVIDDEDLELRGSGWGALAFAEASIRLAPGVSLGVAVDRLFAPSVRLPAMPKAFLPAGTYGGGNATVGFTLEYHF